MDIKKPTTHLLTYLHRKQTNNKPQSHTSLVIYDRKDWLEFKHILDYEGTNPNRVFWSVVETVLEQFDQKEKSLDKFLEAPEIVTPLINTEPEKVLQYLKTLPIEEQKKLEAYFQRNYVYIKALTQGETDLDNFVHLYQRYGTR